MWPAVARHVSWIACSRDTFASAGCAFVCCNCGWIWQGYEDLELDCSPASPTEIHRIKETVMRK